jgi:hypothetical protein
VRKVKEGETTNDIYAFLTTEPNAEVGAVHPKAMPVILTTPEDVETWMTAPAGEALKLQRPLPDGSLRIVARGVKEIPARARRLKPGLVERCTSPQHFQGDDHAVSKAGQELQTLMTDPINLRICRALTAIEDQAMRFQFVRLVESVSGIHGE